VSIYFQKDDEKMSKGFMSQMTRPEEGERGLGASHRRGGMGEASYRRPPEGSHLRNFPEGKRGASATSKAPEVKRKVESMRDKGAKRAASGKLHIDDGCMGGGEDISFKNELTEDMEDYLYNNQGYDGTGSFGFKPGRAGIFHYCIIACYNDGSHDTLGESYTPSDEFQIFSQSVLDETSSTTKWSMNFMHELGHNLGLDDNTGKSMDQGLYDIVDYSDDADTTDDTKMGWYDLDFSMPHH